jgi:hypothetical protein
VFSRLEAEAKEPQNNETFVRYSDTHPNALVLSHKILTEDSDPFGFGLCTPPSFAHYLLNKNNKTINEIKAFY